MLTGDSDNSLAQQAYMEKLQLQNKGNIYSRSGGEISMQHKMLS